MANKAEAKSVSVSVKPSVVDICALERPAAGVSGVPLPSSGMAKPERLEKLEHREEYGPEAARSEGTYDLPKAYPPRRTSAAMQDHQKHAVAMAVVSGLPINEIASMVRHTPAYVKKCLAEDPKISEYVEHYTSISMRATVEHKFAMFERFDKAYKVLDDALVDSDMRVRLTAMDKVFAGSQLTGGYNGPVVEMNFTDPDAHRALTEATVGIHNLLTKIQGGEIKPESINKHLHSTLPGPEDVVGHNVKKED